MWVNISKVSIYPAELMGQATALALSLFRLLGAGVAPCATTVAALADVHFAARNVSGKTKG